MQWLKVVGELALSVATAIYEGVTANEERRRQLLAAVAEKARSYLAWWEGFNQRADDRINRELEEADQKPPKPASEDETTKP